MQASVDRRPKRFLRPRQIIRERNFPKTRLYDDLARGHLRHVRLGRAILISEDDFDDYVARLSVGGDESRAA